jgi:cell division protein FtsB
MEENSRILEQRIKKMNELQNEKDSMEREMRKLKQSAAKLEAVHFLDN